MLASVLPGFRELRAPFAAGSIILAALYVAAYSRFQSAMEDDRLGPGLDSLVRLLGPQGRAVVVGVAVYLVGTVFVSTVRGIVRRMNIALLPSVANLRYVDGKQSWSMSVLAPFSRASLRRIIGLCEHEFADVALATTVCSEVMTGGGKRLLVKNKDLYVEWDRTRTEAEFRDAVIGPALIFALVALVALDWPQWGKVAAFVSLATVTAVLWIHARRLDREANSMYAHAVADGTVATAAIDEKREAAPFRK